MKVKRSDYSTTIENQILKKYLRLTGEQSFNENNHKIGVTGKYSNAISSLTKEFGKSRWTILEYLRFSSLPEYAKNAMKSGVPQKQFVVALRAPADIRDLIMRKVADGAFKNAVSVKRYIRDFNTTTPEEGIHMEEQKSYADQLRDLFRTKGEVVATDAAKQLYGNDGEKYIRNLKSIVYSITNSLGVELQKMIVWKGDRWVLEDPTVDQPLPQVSFVPLEKAPTASRSKTAVLVIKEIRQNGQARYELDVVGDFNRGMIKEALKQLMEVYI